MGTLRQAFARVRKNKGAPGVDGVAVEEFEALLEDNLEQLAGELASSSYRPQPVRRVSIPKPGGKEKRHLGIPTVRDRVVQASLLQVLEPLYEPGFADHSYGFRPGRGAKDALRRVEALLESGYTQVVDADIEKYFDSIPHELLLELVQSRVQDGRVIGLIRSFLEAGVMADRICQEVQESILYPEQGTPQGGVISPLLANIYLDPLDQLLAEEGLQMVRYADDFVILCRSRQETSEALELVKQWMARAGLVLHPEKTNILDATQKGIEFLGYHLESGRRWPRKKSRQKLMESVRSWTRRSQRLNLAQAITQVNEVLKGWFAYFRHSTEPFDDQDREVARRLRSFMRFRKGVGARRSEHWWPDSFFTDRGLFSLAQAHSRASKGWT